MSTAKQPATEEPRPTPSDDHPPAAKQEPRACLVETEFFFDTDVGLKRRVLRTLKLRGPPVRRSSSEKLADPGPADQPRPSTPTPTRRPATPQRSQPTSSSSSSSSSSSPPRSEWKTPESDRTITKLETSPSSSSSASSSTRSKRSVDTEGDVRMLNAALSGPETLRLQLRDEVRAMVAQGVHDNFELERARFADEVRGQVLATLGDEVEWLVRERVDRAVVAAAGEPAESEMDAVVAVRERLRRMGDEARVRVFCTEEMVEVLRSLVGVVDLEMRTEAWSLVEGDERWD